MVIDVTGGQARVYPEKKAEAIPPRDLVQTAVPRLRCCLSALPMWHAKYFCRASRATTQRNRGSAESGSEGYPRILQLDGAASFASEVLVGAVLRVKQREIHFFVVFAVDQGVSRPC